MEGLAFFVEALEIDEEGIEKEIGSMVTHCDTHLSDANDRTKPNGSSDQVTYFCRP
jgi:hypothetical protein